MNTALAIHKDDLKIRRAEFRAEQDKASLELVRELAGYAANIAANPIIVGIGGFWAVEKIKDGVMTNPSYSWLEKTSITAGYAGLQAAILTGLSVHGFGGVAGITKLIGALK